MEDIFKRMLSRRSIRSFRQDPVPVSILHKLLEASRWAPSGGNSQNHIFGVITDEAMKLALARAAGEQMWIAEAPVVLACCARLYMPEEESDFSKEVNTLRWGKDAFDWFQSCPDPYYMALLFHNSVPLMAGSYLQLAAAEYGLGTCWIGFLDIEKASDLLRLPPDIRCYFLMPLGYPAENPEPDRLPLSHFTFSEMWPDDWPLASEKSPLTTIHKPPAKKQLRMIWPAQKSIRQRITLPDGYVLRNFREEDSSAYLALMHQAGFEDYSYQLLGKMRQSLLPNGFFVIESTTDRMLVASAMANHDPLGIYPDAGAINWVAASKKHSGRGLGRAVTTATLNKLINCHYQSIYLTTDDFRLPAIKTYLKMGFQPDYYLPDMQTRWSEIFQQLQWQA